MRDIYCPSCGFRFQIPDITDSKVSLVNEYDVEHKIDTMPKTAVPEVSEYRERFKNRKLTINDVKAKNSAVDKPPALDSELERFGNLIVGEGLQVEG